MKKIVFSIILLVSLVLGMCACDGKDDSALAPDLNKPFCVLPKLGSPDELELI